MSEKSRNRILKAAVKTFAENHLASMDEVAEAAGVGRATLYRIFGSRKELMDALFIEAEEKVSELVKQIDFSEHSSTVLGNLVSAMIPLGDSFHFLNYEPLHRDSEADKAYRKHMDFLKEFVIKMKEDGVVRSDIPTAWAASSLDVLIWTIWLSIRDGEVAAGEATDILINTYLKGVG